MMAERLKASVLHDDSRIVAWDQVMKVYPGTTPLSLGYPGVLIRIWRMADVNRAARAPIVKRDGRFVAKAGDLRSWTIPDSGRTWDDEAADAWQNPTEVLSAGKGPITLYGKKIESDGIRSLLRTLALEGPDGMVPVVSGN